jgi:hypothetical protein
VAGSAVSVGACAGDVAFYSDTSWAITGGHRPVQSPTQVVWPCGTYTIVATSRVDPSRVQTRTITVGPKARTVVDLR